MLGRLPWHRRSVGITFDRHTSQPPHRGVNPSLPGSWLYPRRAICDPRQFLPPPVFPAWRLVPSYRLDSAGNGDLRLPPTQPDRSLLGAGGTPYATGTFWSPSFAAPSVRHISGTRADRSQERPAGLGSGQPSPQDRPPTAFVARFGCSLPEPESVDGAAPLPRILVPQTGSALADPDARGWRHRWLVGRHESLQRFTGFG